MRPNRLFFSAADGLPCPDTRLLEGVLEVWPGTSRPEIVRKPIHDLSTLLTHNDDECEAALIVLSTTTPARDVDRLVESFLSANIPAIFLAPKAEDWLPLQRHGVIILSWSTDAAIVAGTLFGLSQRQSAVELLAREVSQSERSAGGIRDTIEHLHDELHLAASIQRDFTLAPLPKVEGLDIEVLFRPVNFVSGDIYAVHPLGDGLLSFFVADAVGHGVPAAMLTMVLTNCLQTTEPSQGRLPRVLEPTEVLDRLNRRLIDGCMGQGRFATAVYGLIDTKLRRISIATAGHPAPVIVSPRGVKAIDCDGPLLAIFDDAVFTQTTINLNGDETLVVYTDGLEAAFPYQATKPGMPRVAQHIDELLKLAGDRHFTPLREIVDDLTSLLDLQDGSLHRSDDVTALVIGWSRHAGTVAHTATRAA
jgi:phosphoserine phosphatase RsbU/P